jgi:hypothetical protein
MGVVPGVSGLTKTRCSRKPRVYQAVEISRYRLLRQKRRSKSAKLQNRLISEIITSYATLRLKWLETL